MTSKKIEAQTVETTELNEGQLDNAVGGLNFTKIEYKNVRVATGDVNGADALAQKV